MADVRPFPGIRYQDTADIAQFVAPPYDVISPDLQRRLYERHPHNIVRLELGLSTPDDDQLNNVYSRAARTFAEWRRDGILRQDPPSLYIYEQRFSVGQQRHARVGLCARVRLEPWEAGVILPHERTLSKPKDDRLHLMRACAANLSPIMTLYQDPDHTISAMLQPYMDEPPLLQFVDDAGEEHRLWSISNEDDTKRACAFFAGRQLFIADGHHRYETALTYRNEQAALRKEELLADDAANFTFMTLCSLDDPGLIVLPTHRIVRQIDPARLEHLHEALAASFDIESLPADMDADALVARIAQEQRRDQSAFIMVERDAVTLLTLKPSVDVRAHSNPQDVATGASDAWWALDVAILHELILRQALDISAPMVQAGGYVSYTRDAAQACSAVRAGTDDAQLAFLMNPAPPAAVRDVARAGDRMPQKSTYFYPKLMTGLVINPVW